NNEIRSDRICKGVRARIDADEEGIVQKLVHRVRNNTVDKSPRGSTRCGKADISVRPEQPLYLDFQLLIRGRLKRYGSTVIHQPEIRPLGQIEIVKVYRRNPKLNSRSL